MNPAKTRLRCPKRVWLVYATQTGKSERLCYEIRYELWKIGIVGYPTSIQVFENVFFSYFESFESKVADVEFPMTIFVVSTTGQGDFPDSMISFWNRLLLNKVNKELIKKFSFSIFGMGDRCFGDSRFNLAARKLRHSLLNLGASEKVLWGLGDESHDFGVLGEFDPWIRNLIETLVKCGYQLSETETSFFKRTFPPNRYICEVLKTKQSQENELKDAIAAQKKHIDSFCANKGGGFVKTSISEVTYNHEYEGEFKSRRTKFIKMKILDKMGETNGHGSGSYVSVWPRNPNESVVEFSKLMNNTDLTLNSVIVIKENPEYHSCLCSDNYKDECEYREKGREDALFCNHTRCYVLEDSMDKGVNYGIPLNLKMTVFTLLHRYLDITSIPDRRFVRLCYNNTNSELHKEKLFEMLQKDSDSKKEYFDFIVDEHRSHTELLWDFNSVKLSLEDVINTVPLILPRYYSICNSENWYNRDLWHYIYLKHCIKDAHGGTVIPDLLRSDLSLLVRKGGEDYGTYKHMRNKAILSYLNKRTGDFSETADHSNIDICVDIIEWNTPLNRKIKGLCSNFLDRMGTSLGEDSRVLVAFGNKINPATQCEMRNPKTPILLLSCGLGITGIISTIQERVLSILSSNQDPEVNCLVYLGMRYSNVKYPFIDQIHDFCKNKELKDRIQISISYSRRNPDIKESVFYNDKCINLNSLDSGCYIQKLLLMDKNNSHNHVVNCLINGYVVICGNALTMPLEVRETLSEILVLNGKFETVQDSMLYIKRLIRYGRYIEETWK